MTDTWSGVEGEKAEGDFWDDIESDDAPFEARKYTLDGDGNLPAIGEGPEPGDLAHLGVPTEEEDPEKSVIIYEGLSARFEDGATLEKKLSSVAGLTMFVKAGPLLLGDLFEDLYVTHSVTDEEIGQHFDLAEGTVKNMRMWARKIPAQNRRPGIETTLAQEAASIKDVDEQRSFIERALKEGLSKADMRAVKSGKEPGSGDTGNTVDMQKCPTCGTNVRAELLGG